MGDGVAGALHGIEVTSVDNATARINATANINIKRCTDCLHSGGHIGSGVPVGHREYIEVVKNGPPQLQRHGEPSDDIDQIVGIEPLHRATRPVVDHR